MTNEENSLSQLGGIAAKMADAFNAKDAARLAQMYGKDAVLMPPGEPAVTGRAAIRSWFEKAMGRSGQIRIMPVEMRVLEDEAFQVGNFQVQRDDNSSVAAKYVLLLRRADGQWLIQHDIWNLSQPPAEISG